MLFRYFLKGKIVRSYEKSCPKVMAELKEKVKEMKRNGDPYFRYTVQRGIEKVHLVWYLKQKGFYVMPNPQRYQELIISLGPLDSFLYEGLF